MEFGHDFFSGPTYINSFGKSKLEALQEQARSVKAEPCPFCGGEAVLELGR